MKKSLKIMLISLMLLFLVFCVKCFAVNIDMNLASNLIDVASNVTDTNSIANASVNSYTNTNDTANSTISNATSNMDAAQSTTNTNSNSSSATFTNLSSLPESELGLTNILNILLIAIGFVLILLAIAIFIKINK